MRESTFERRTERTRPPLAWARSSVLGCVLAVALLWSGSAGARQELTPAADAPVVATEAPPTIPPTPAPTDIPPTAIPSSPPTAIPPSPTFQPTAEPTSDPTPLPAPTEQVWINLDTLALADGQPPETASAPGAESTHRFVYQATTPRTSTTIQVTLQNDSGDPAGWQFRIVSPVGPGSEWTPGGMVAVATDASAFDPDSTFDIVIDVRAPASVTTTQTATLHLESVAATPNGTTESGVADTGHLASITTTPPAPTPTAEPTCTGAPTLPTVTTTSTGFGTTNASSEGYSPLRNTVSVTVSLPDANQCLVPNWSISVSTTAMTNGGGGIIPASDITFGGITNLTGLADAGLPTNTPLNTPQIIVTGTSESLDAETPSTSFHLTIDLLPPADTPPGTYGGEIVVDSIVAP